MGSRPGSDGGTVDPPLNLAGMTMRANDVSKTVRSETRVYVMRVSRQ